jgi:hypothetical protein
MISRMRKLVCVLAAGILLGAPGVEWAQSRHIHEDVDPYSHLRVLSLGDVSTKACPGDPGIGPHDPVVELIFSVVEKPDQTVEYLMTADLSGGSPLNLGRGGTMDSLMDEGVGWFVTPMGSTVNTGYSYSHSFLHETIPFHVTRENLEVLSKTQMFQFRINGSRQSVQRCVDAKRLRDLPEFLGVAATYGPPQLGDSPAFPASEPIVEEVNPSTQLKVLTLTNIATQPCPGDPSPGPQDADVHLTISANQRADGGVWYFISTDISRGATLSLRRGDTLQTQMDGASAVFRTINGSRVSYGPDAIPHETTAFHVHQPDLIALSKTSLLEFRINGPTGTVRRCARAAQFRYLSEFIRIAAHYEPSPVAAVAPPH